jgi:membrane-bound lytic murein transglycosylase MltF
LNLVNKKVVLCSVHIIIAYNNNVMKRPKTSLSLKKKNAPLPRGDAKIQKNNKTKKKKNPRTGWRAGIP